ncbi:MAG: 3-isopropylmalate dehydrogenase [Gemmatimonadota bacterium]
MSAYRIALIPGDGVGPEVTTAAVDVLEAAARSFGFSYETSTFDWGCDYYLEHSRMMPDDALAILAGFDAIFLGCIGDAAKVPDHLSLELLLDIRKGFDQYVNLRPIKLYPGVPTPLTTATPDTVDMMVVRENTEGEYARVGGIFGQGANAVALQTGVFTRRGCERVIRYAFELAETRNKLEDGDHRGRVTNCTKSNALNYSMVFWDEVFADVATDFPAVATDAALVDALTMWMVKNPEWFDVIVASNLFGDIITDLGAMLQGGMGFAAGGNINPEGAYPSMFEPIHGSAPKYTGQQRVNPIASIEAIRMMLDHLGETDAAAAVERAVSSTLAAGLHKTADIGGTSRTYEVARVVADDVG